MGNLSFNPCFNGFTSLTSMKYKYINQIKDGFNPCFNGFTSLTIIIIIPFLNNIEFQSLF